MNDREDDKQFQMWARQIKIRDQWECQICGARGVYLEAHHKWGWNSFPEKRYDLDCGITLCQRCHQRFHETYGYGGNTEYQFNEYAEIAETLKKVAAQQLIKSRQRNRAEPSHDTEVSIAGEPDKS